MSRSSEVAWAFGRPLHDFDGRIVPEHDQAKLFDSAYLPK
jgi:hypothetical protein